MANLPWPSDISYGRVWVEFFTGLKNTTMEGSSCG